MDQLESHIAKIETIHTDVKKKISIAQDKMKKSYDKKQLKGYKCFEFSIGDIVLKRNMNKLGRKGWKLEHNWTGPYKLVKIQKNSYVLSKDGVVLKTRTNPNQLKPYFSDKVKYLLISLMVINSK